MKIKSKRLHITYFYYIFILHITKIAYFKIFSFFYVQILYKTKSEGIFPGNIFKEYFLLCLYLPNPDLTTNHFFKTYLPLFSQRWSFYFYQFFFQEFFCMPLFKVKIFPFLYSAHVISKCV